MRKMSAKLLKLFQEQIKHEYESRNVYFGMESYLKGENWNGFGNFMKIQADEEMIHTRYFMDFLLFVGEKFEMPAIKAQTNEYESVLDVFKKGLKHEEFITSKIHALYDQAFTDKNYLAMKFLDWYVNEQAEEEENFNELVTRIERTKDIDGLAVIDEELAARVLTQPANPPVSPK